MEMSIVAEDRKSMLQGSGRNPHVIRRDRPTAASEVTIHGCIMFGCLNIYHELIDPIRRQKLLQFLVIFLLAVPTAKPLSSSPSTMLFSPIRGAC